MNIIVKNRHLDTTLTYRKYCQVCFWKLRMLNCCAFYDPFITRLNLLVKVCWFYSVKRVLISEEIPDKGNLCFIEAG